MYLYSGIRGVYMDILKPIPASLFIRNSKARIYYEGFKNRCFHCKADDHLKINCPQLQEVPHGKYAERSTGSGLTETGPLLYIYANMAAGMSSKLSQRLEQARQESTDPNDEKNKPTGSDQSANNEELDYADDHSNEDPDMEIEGTNFESSIGTKRALKALRSTSDDSNYDQGRAKKTKSLLA